MPKSNIVLIGFMCAGKTTVGNLVARAMGRRFLDTDAVIESEAGLSVREIFDREGETGFRRMEREVVARITGCKGLVIALGGGAVLDENNSRDARRDGVVYYLHVSPPEFARRVSPDRARPLLEGRSEQEVEKMLCEREPVYLEAADVCVRTDTRPPEDVAAWIKEDFRARSGRRLDGKEHGG